MQLDMDFVRAQFPAFAEPSLAGQAFFENAGGSYTCKPVIDRLTRFYHQRKVQPYYPFEASRLGGEEMDEARGRLALMLGVATDEVSFGPSTSANTYVLAQAFRQHLAPGDAIIVTNQDHEANTGPWRRLADAGIEVREWQIDPATGHLPLDRLPELLKGAKLLCFPHCSNVVGEINPVAEICAMAQAEGAATCVDGVSYAPHGFADVGALGADIYLFSAYKTYGPHQGIMVIRRPLGMALPNQGHYFNGEVLYKRFTPAGPDHAQIAACAGMADYVDALAEHHGAGDLIPKARAAMVHDLMRAHEATILQPLLDYLGTRNELRLLGPKSAVRRAPTVSVQAGETGHELARALAEQDVMVGGGTFYADRALHAQGVDLDRGVLRMSFVHYTTAAEVDQLIGALDRVL
ncbi:aminotransferase class V-fold PLP-dependent enzyme [Pararhodobacter zhoushanensis]|uniref:Aminotransferase class V-fold PLP-dependent enzyme n=1 Tax=Pararhodobacter zhoushanensis TaxID=2479545 RepID=A0ABT3H0Q7_9RHOB|nr:aminotransferase class V-fold PLP-dependent enzyme [Pararhodobacter zhoushanensis]MCW1933298.1 aminotransferase class V-fold PLP-dependent enzyme [Pararhodobacter zhoushanensis]